MQVLIGVDGSAGALAAVRMAGRLLTGERDRVRLYFSVPYAHLDHDQHAARIEQAQDALAREVFDQALGELPEPLRAQTDVLVSMARPYQGLLEAAREWPADLIVVGARGRGPIAQMMLGSVARRVVHLAPQPVLVVRDAADDAEQPLRVLLACDAPHESSFDAIDFLAQLGLPDSAYGEIVTVIESYTTAGLPEWLAAQPRDPEVEALSAAWIAEHDAERATKRQELENARRRLPAAFQTAEPIIAEGNPADEILRRIESEKFNLVVVGSGQKGLLGRWVLGSVSDSVLTYAGCSVLVVPRREAV